MLAKRIIPCLDIKDGRTVKGVNFIALRDAGDPVELAEIYSREGADELVFLDISATEQRRKTLAELVFRVAEKVNIPFTVGGGISSVEDVDVLLQNGADKVSINSSAVKNPKLINDLVAKFGSQCIVVAIDAETNRWGMDRTSGRWKSTYRTKTFRMGQRNRKCAAPEKFCSPLWTTMVPKTVLPMKALARLSTELNIPIIASGGGGKYAAFRRYFYYGKSRRRISSQRFSL